MMGAWFQPEESAIQHVRQPGQGMPIAGVAAAEGPPHTRPGDARANGRVLRDIIPVVEIDEVVPVDGPVEGNGYRGQPEADDRFTAHSHPLIWKRPRKAMRNEGCVVLRLMPAGFYAFSHTCAGKGMKERRTRVKLGG